MQEVWKDVKGFEDIYQVSNLGNVKSLVRYKKILKPFTDSLGRKQCTLWFKDKKRYCRVHRLVAEAFIENKENKPCVNHIDNDPSNNNVLNLEWCTYQENTDHMMRQKRNKNACGEDSSRAKLKENDVNIIINMAKIKTYYEISKELQLNRATVYDIIKNKTWKHIKR